MIPPYLADTRVAKLTFFPEGEVSHVKLGFNAVEL